MYIAYIFCEILVELELVAPLHEFEKGVILAKIGLQRHSALISCFLQYILVSIL